MTYRELIQINSKKAEELNKEKSAIVMMVRELAGFSPSELYINYDSEVLHQAFIQEQVNAYLENNVPPQYVLGYTYFYGNKIMVNPDVLIPRAETEILVTEVLKQIDKDKKVKVVDIGTGSGCIAIAVKKQRPKTEVFAFDISLKAIDIARKNAEMNDVEITFKQNDLLSGIKDKFDVLISNPPYIDKSDFVEDIVLKNEPSSSLFAREKGLYFYRKILEEANIVMNSNYVIAFEIGYNQAQEVLVLADKFFPEAKKKVIKDLSGNDRVVIIHN
ncbi:MAG: peptide chain release factor N(5)-glutamine methyltransferase [Bacilli bacterium]|mgnify:FL=1|jgi:release factor glutamine methyltransferase|nr:peptide chain release factor N(5)-glutamine methyltransferase [Bacilli bacterium]